MNCCHNFIISECFGLHEEDRDPRNNKSECYGVNVHEGDQDPRNKKSE